ncbi:hypothetical protein B9G98_01500 [Wickerhamiella sorbophila]|uniref:Uncharacterized protein n=1 Tax=Wickerhamiella sorbophila TaxID=45607 RepID=A0A2T0FFX9_9ASCO|nr:hypothetical protein B9G98_01500 [Wickerhamiella sorbophila]PRT53880.1 hypothetical protein B9G98_01500 [Wickerhamiella sorbophila]
MSKKKKLNGNGGSQAAVVENTVSTDLRRRNQSKEWKAGPAAPQHTLRQASQLQNKYNQRCSQKKYFIRLAKSLEKTEIKLRGSVAKNLKLVSEELRRGTSLTLLLQQQGELDELPFEQEILKFCRVCRNSLTTLILSVGHDMDELGRALGGDPKFITTSSVDMRVAELDLVSIDQKLMDNESQIGWLETIISTASSNSVDVPRTQHLIYANDMARKIHLRLLSLKHRLVFYFCDTVEVINRISFARVKTLYETNEKALARLQQAVSILQKVLSTLGLMIVRKRLANQPDPFTFKVVASTTGSSAGNSADESEVRFAERDENVSLTSLESSSNFVQVVPSQGASTSQEDIHFSDLTHSDAVDESDGFDKSEFVAQRQMEESENDGDVESMEHEVSAKTTPDIEPNPSVQSEDTNTNNTAEFVVESIARPTESQEEQMSIESQQGRLNVHLGEGSPMTPATEGSPKSMVVRLYTGISQVLTKSAQSAKNVISNAESFLATGAADLDLSTNDEVVVPPPVAPLNTVSKAKKHVDSPHKDARPLAKRIRLSLPAEPVAVPRASSVGPSVIPPSVEPPVRREIVVSDHSGRRAGPSRTHKTAQPLKLVKRKASPELHLVAPEGEQQDESLRKVLRRLFEIVQK